MATNGAAITEPTLRLDLTVAEIAAIRDALRFALPLNSDHKTQLWGSDFMTEYAARRAFGIAERALMVDTPMFGEGEL
jgi:hypothetical protein